MPDSRLASQSRRILASVALATGALASFACGGDDPLAPIDATRVAAGTWGGDGAGAIVTDSVMHVHIGCTFGDIMGIVALTNAGTFDRQGSYMPRAYPIAIGPSVPARFVGRVQGRAMTITVTVNDTVAKMERVYGPVTVTYDVDPRLGPCPICSVPGMKAPAPGLLERLRRYLMRVVPAVSVNAPMNRTSARISRADNPSESRGNV